MTLREFERRLQRCNPRLHIKRYGTSKVGIHNSGRYVCRIMPGDITPYNQFQIQKGRHSSAVTPLNPGGLYKWKLLVGRGRMEAARVLYTSRHIKLRDVAYLSK